MWLWGGRRWPPTPLGGALQLAAAVAVLVPGQLLPQGADPLLAWLAAGLLFAGETLLLLAGRALWRDRTRR